MKTYQAGLAATAVGTQRLDIGTRQLGDYRAEKASKRASVDLPFLSLTLLLLTIGVVMVLSASFARSYYTSGDPMQYFSSQTVYAVTGVVLMLVVSRIRLSVYMRMALPIFIIALLLLAAVPFVGEVRNGARRWLSLGFTTFQPSEIVKLAEVLLFANMICVYKDKMKTFKFGVAPFVLVVVLVVGLLYLEPHLSASVIVVMIAGIMMFAGGTRMRWFAVALILIAAVAYVTLTQLDYAAERVTAWQHPEEDPGDNGYQILQSLYAIGSGGLFGLGLGQSRQKYLYLPEEHNDYIFSVVCEELGYIGAVLILMLFALLIIRGFWLALHAKDRFSSLVVTGLTSLLALQVFLNVAVVTNLLPSTGISLPFFSAGGTALWIQLVEMGIILSVSRDIPIAKAG